MSIWVLLSPLQLPPASQTSCLLGSITLDFEDPLANSVPENVELVLSSFADKVVETTDENFEAILSRDLGSGAYTRLGDIARFRFGKDIRDSRSMKSLEVKTKWLKEQKTIFNAIKLKHGQEIQALMNETKNRKPSGTLYMVVGIKTCFDASVTSGASSRRERSAEIAAPMNEAIQGAIGKKPTVDLNLAVGGNKSAEETTQNALILRGERIFAIQYRLIKKIRDWWETPLPKRPVKIDFGHYHTVPRVQGLFSGEQDDERDESEELEESDLDIGDPEHANSLQTQSDTAVIIDL